MKLSVFKELLEEGVPFKKLWILGGKDVKTAAADKEQVTPNLFSAMDNFPAVTWGTFKESFNKAIEEQYLSWGTLPTITDKIEVVSDLELKTKGKVQLTPEDCQKYFDQLLKSDNASLAFTLYNSDKSTSFKALLYPEKLLQEKKDKYSWIDQMPRLEVNEVYLAAYVLQVSPDERDVELAEAIVRGSLIVTASALVGKLLNSKFSQMFVDFI